MAEDSKKQTKKRRRARVVLRGAKTYQLAGRRFIENVPQVIVGDALVEQFMMNGYFSCTELDGVAVKKKKKKKQKVQKPEDQNPPAGNEDDNDDEDIDDDDEDEETDGEGDAEAKGKVTLNKN